MIRQELSVLRGAMRILRKSPHVMIILQLYGHRLKPMFLRAYAKEAANLTWF